MILVAELMRLGTGCMAGLLICLCFECRRVLAIKFDIGDLNIGLLFQSNGNHIRFFGI